MSQFESPFLAVPMSDWLCSNDLCFAIFDGFPVSPGHILVTTHRIVETWFDATDEEQAALMALVKESKRLLDLQLDPKPDKNAQSGGTGEFQTKSWPQPQPLIN
jgi:diadenosine tetraphosphate (Ap4A) HIT family hydrolase